MVAVLRRVGPAGVFLLVFLLLAWLVHVLFPPIEALEIKRVARDFANAWTAGRLESLNYDPRSAPDVGNADPERIAANTIWLTRDISPVDSDRPTKVDLVGDPSNSLDGSTASQALDVTWDLGRGRSWTYRTTLSMGKTEGRLRVVWRPTIVHPWLQHGLILKSRRVLATRAPIQTFQGQELPPSTSDQLAGELVGTIAPVATHELAELDPGRIAPGDPVGVSGLQQLYDAQLAGEAGLEVDVVQDPNYAPLEPVRKVAYTSPPTPGRPLVTTINYGWQQRAEDALAGIKDPAAIVAIDVNSGQILAAADAGTVNATGKGPQDRALQGQYPPGDTFRLVTMLAAYRFAKLTPSSQTDCSPLNYNGQQFKNKDGAPDGTVSVAQAFASGCRTAFARAALNVRADDLTAAARSLGFGDDVPPDYPSFLGSVPSTPPPNTDAGIALAQTGVGEGQVLASPLALARAVATVATGKRIAPSLIVTAPRTAPVPSQTLSVDEAQILQSLLTQAVASDGDLTPLRAVPGGAVAAVGGTAAYGPATTAPRISWVTGYQGTTAFAVLLTKPSSDRQQAAKVAAALLGKG